MADLKIKYGSSFALAITLASLATSSTLVAGQESDAIDNSANLYDDVLLGGKITVGTSPTVDKQIDIWVYAAVDTVPTYPDVFDGADSNEAVTSVNVRNGALRLLASLRVDNTSDRTYWLAPTSIAALYGGVMPRNWGVFVTHNTGVNLNATGGNHALTGIPITYTAA